MGAKVTGWQRNPLVGEAAGWLACGQAVPKPGTVSRVCSWVAIGNLRGEWKEGVDGV